MSHPRLHNPRARMAQRAEAARVKRPPRHAFQADRALTALWQELSAAQRPQWLGSPWYRAGSADVAVLSVWPGFSVWCCKGKFMWQDATLGIVTHPANDPGGAAARLGPSDAPMGRFGPPMAVPAPARPAPTAAPTPQPAMPAAMHPAPMHSAPMAPPVAPAPQRVPYRLAPRPVLTPA